MRIAYVTAGAGGMYCGTCLHDNTLAAALKRLGHDVLLLPLYLPFRSDEEDVSHPAVHYGALGVFLQQGLALFRRTPAALDRLLAGPRLLRLVGRLGAATDPGRLGALTLSVLRGEDGRQAKELERLASFLAGFRPEVVCLSSSLLAGLAGRLRRSLKAPVVCFLQGEDLFLEDLDAAWRESVRQELRARAAQVSAFAAPGRAHAATMAGWLGIAADSIAVVPLGIRLDGHAPPGVRPAGAPFVIGYLARVAPEKGLHHLAQAFVRLAAMAGPEAVELRACGWMGSKHRAYLAGVRSLLASHGLASRFSYTGEVDRDGKLRFLRGLDVLSVPTDHPEAKGLFALEALASGVPAVLPEHGCFPELVAETGGGVLVPPKDPEALAGALAALAQDPAQARALGLTGREAVMRSRSDTAMAAATVRLLEATIAATLASIRPPSGGSGR